jgi:hypothetical protein
MPSVTPFISVSSHGVVASLVGGGAVLNCTMRDGEAFRGIAVVDAAAAEMLDEVVFEGTTKRVDGAVSVASEGAVARTSVLELVDDVD